MKWPPHPVVYEINTWVWLDDLSRQAESRITLGSVPDSELNRLAEYGFDAVWLMGVWQRSQAARELALQNEELKAILPDFTRDDVVGSPFAVTSYHVEARLGGDEGLCALRERLADHGLRLILDFIPNHMARDHEWLVSHPSRFVQGTRSDLARDPGNYFLFGQEPQSLIFAHGRDPSFPGWPDTVQLDYRHHETRSAMTEVLLQISELCDGVRCDMAMLLLNDVFHRTWGGHFDLPNAAFWRECINSVKAKHPGFMMLAEVYWGCEQEVQSQGFDYTYDKDAGLYDRLKGGAAWSVRDHLGADLSFQSKLARFVENHDEDRAVVVFGPLCSRAVAALALTLPGMRLVHEGQMEGRRQKLPVQIGRRPTEEPDKVLESFYRALLEALSHPVFHKGTWRLLVAREAWEGNASHANILVSLWTYEESRWLVVVNLASGPSQCYLPLEQADLADHSWLLKDHLTDDEYVKQGDGLLSPGLYLDLAAYEQHIFELQQQTLLPLARRHTLMGPRSGSIALAWSSDGRQLASASRDGDILIWDCQSGECLCRLDGHPKEVYALAWSPDGHVLASGSMDRTVRLWDVHNRAIVRILEGHTNNVLSLAWSSDGQTIATGSMDCSVRLWEASTGRTRERITGPDDAVNSVAWCPTDKRLLAYGCGDKTVYLWDVELRQVCQTLRGHDWVSSIAWSPNGEVIASGNGGATIDIWNIKTGRKAAICAGHTSRVLCVAFSSDGRLLVSKAADHSVRFWRCRDWACLFAEIEEHGECLSGLAFSPQEPVLATRDDKTNNIHIWGVDVQQVLDGAPTVPFQSLSAKVVLIGESGVGKSGLGIRFATGRYEPTASTHGARCWGMPVPPTIREALSTISREAYVNLWDFAGHPDYRLIHQLFLNDTTVAMVLFDSTDANDPLRGVAYWAQVLARHCPGAIKYLISSRIDTCPVRAGPEDIQDVLDKYGFAGHITTSAVTGQGVEALKKNVFESIPWGDITPVASPELFRVIRDVILEQKRHHQTFVTMESLHEQVVACYQQYHVKQADLDTVIGQLESRNLLFRLVSGGDRTLVLLRPEVIHQYASCVIRASRESRIVGTVQEQDVLCARISLTGFERLEPEAENLVLPATVELLIQHAVCHREMGMLIFPSQISGSCPFSKENRPRTLVTYRFSGSVEAIYGSLVVRLHHTKPFEMAAQWRYGSEFANKGDRFGFEMTLIDEQRAQLAVYATRGLDDNDTADFVLFIRNHLLQRGINLEEVVHVWCPVCGRRVRDEDAIRERLRQGYREICCSCGKAVLIEEPIVQRYGDKSSHVQRQSVLEEEADKGIATEAGDLKDAAMPVAQIDNVLRILHLSDIHLRDPQDVDVYFGALETDLRRELTLDKLDYLVISGDIANSADPTEYRGAFEFVSRLATKFGLDPGRVVIVPGNHDVNWRLSAQGYQFVSEFDPKYPGSSKGCIPAPEGALVRNRKYVKRFEPFSKEFYQKVYYTKKGYPFDEGSQGILCLNDQDRVLFLALNSCWEVDHHFNKPSISPRAVSRALERLQGGYDGWLKIAVWHHPLIGKDAMERDWLRRLVQCGFSIGLHGHRHSAIEGSYDGDSSGHVRMHIIGAGTFGAPSTEWVPGIPLEYHLLICDPVTRSITVECRRKETTDGPWFPDARYRERSSADPVPRYVIQLDEQAWKTG